MIYVAAAQNVKATSLSLGLLLLLFQMDPCAPYLICDSTLEFVLGLARCRISHFPTAPHPDQPLLPSGSREHSFQLHNCLVAVVTSTATTQRALSAFEAFEHC